MAMTFRSPAFAHGTTIPTQFTCNGENLVPPLEWAGVPGGAETLLITCDDPDAPRGTFHHWAVYNIPATQTGRSDVAPPGIEAITDFGKPGYGGPCPPPGDPPHRYVFRLAALKGRIEAPAATRAAEIRRLARTMELDAAEFIGLFGR